MDYLAQNETENMASVMKNISHAADDKNDNVTDISYIEMPTKWYYILESVLVGVCALIGLAGNLAVIRGSLQTKRSTKQNVYLFIGLSFSDYCVCLTRAPSLIYIIFHTNNSPDIICELWMISTMFLIIATVINMVIAVERRMIMYNFQSYLSIFTPRRVFTFGTITWLSVIGCFLSVYKGLAFRAMFRLNERSCYLATNLFEMDDITATIFRVCAVAMFGVFPITVQALCYVSVVVKVYKAELMKLDKLDEKITYTRITGVAFARVLVTVTCLLPVLICFAIGPMYPDVYYSNVRFLDDLIILHSTISPVISMHDSDFRDMFFSWKSKYFSVFKRRTGSKKGSRRSIGITSADMKTLGLTQNI